MTIKLTDTAAGYSTLTITNISIATKSKKQMFAIRGAAPILIDMGYEGPIYQVTATIDNTNDAGESSAQVVYWRDIAIGTIFTASATSYTEMPNSGDKYFLSDKNINRKGGTIDKWTLTITLVKAAVDKII